MAATQRLVMLVEPAERAAWAALADDAVEAMARLLA